MSKLMIFDPLRQVATKYSIGVDFSPTGRVVTGQVPATLTVRGAGASIEFPDVDYSSFEWRVLTWDLEVTTGDVWHAVTKQKVYMAGRGGGKSNLREMYLRTLPTLRPLTPADELRAAVLWAIRDRDHGN